MNPHFQSVASYHNIDAERSTLGAIFIRNDAMDDVLSFLGIESFWLESHRHVFSAMLALHNEGDAIDIITVADQLHKDGNLEAVGGPNALASLANEVPSSANVLHYANIVREKYAVRQLMAFGDKVREDAQSRSLKEVLLEAQETPMTIAEQVMDMRTHSIVELVQHAYARWEAIHDGQEDALGLLSGIRSLDEMLMGAHSEQLIIGAGRPAMGKSSLGLGWCLNNALQGIPVGFVSLEMEAVKLAQRAMCAYARVNSRKLKAGTASPSEWQRLADALEIVGRSPFYIDDTPQMTLTQFRTLARRWVKRFGVSMIVVDYLQLLVVPNARSREQEIGTISRTLKAIARELHIPIIALAQLSRKVEERKDKRPMTSDLRESGSLEQDADVVLFCYRDHVYNPETSPKLAEIIIGKHREGPIGTAQAGWEGAYTSFVSSTLF